MREQQIVNSALWAAYGDALGFPTELVDEQGVKRRLGSARIETTRPWKRLVGGKTGAWVSLGAGTYSDDTQLRLATSRAIRGDGHFDIETFAKVEMPVWLSYSLGAGRGSKVAATSLGQRNTAWFSNFYEMKDLRYTEGGGNGAAMRIQPHVWAAQNLSDPSTYIHDVVRNSLVTHGHPRAIAGAVIHAACLAVILQDQSIPSPADWSDLSLYIEAATKFVEEDSHLSTFWLPSWNTKAGSAFSKEMGKVILEWERDVEICRQYLHYDPETAYRAVVDVLGGFVPEQRGSGLKCALFSLAAAWLFRERGPNEAVLTVVNLLGSDTDTIGTMTGALVGALFPNEMPMGELQDRPYIIAETKRLYATSKNGKADSFTYPDLLSWQSPKTQLDSVGIVADGIAIAGLGFAQPVGEPSFSSRNDSAWQWFELHFGQSILCKRRVDLTPLAEGSYPAEVAMPQAYIPPQNLEQPRGRKDIRKEREKEGSMHSRDLFGAQESDSPPFETNVSERREGPSGASPNIESSSVATSRTISQLIDKAIKSNFDPRVIGIDLLSFAAQPDGIEKAIAYSALIVKARMARMRGER